MKLSTLENLLWAAGFLGHVALLLVLLIRKRSREFPVFTSFLGFEVFRTALLFLVTRFGTNHAYFLAYWITGFADYGFQVGLIIEIARDVLRPTGSWVSDARRSFILWGTVGLVAAAVTALQLAPSQSKGFDLWDSRITVFTSMLTCQLFAVITVAASNLGLQWRTHVYALGQGLFVWSSFALLEDGAHAIWGWDEAPAGLGYTRMVVYLSVLLYWIVVFWRPEKVRAPLSPRMMEYLADLHQKVQDDLADHWGDPHR